MPFNFPSAASIGVTYSFGDIVWEYNGYAWEKLDVGGSGSAGPPGPTGATGAPGAGVAGNNDVGVMYLKGNTFATTIPFINAREVVVGGITTGTLYNFQKHATTNSLQYLGAGGRFHVIATFNFETEVSNNTCGFYVGLNRNIASGLSADADRISESEVYIHSSSSSKPVGGALQAIVDLNTNDRLFFIVQNKDAAKYILVEFLKFIAVPLTSERGATGATGAGGLIGDYVASINGSTGAITNVARINEGNTFSVRQVMNAGITTANLQVSGGATFSTIYASSTTNTIDAIASTDGIGLRVARSIGGGPSSIGGILLGRSSISQYNYLLYTSTGTFYVINGTGPAASQLMTLNALDVNFNVPIRGATFSSTAGRITVQKSGVVFGGDSGVVRIVGQDSDATNAYNSDIRANVDAAADTTHTLPSTSGTLLNTASSYVISVNGQTGAVTISGGAGATGATGPTGPTEDNITLFIDANPDDITTGNKGYKQIAYDCQPIEWYVLSGQTGSIEFDIKKSSFASYPSTTSIVGTDNPELISQMKNSNTGITAWSGLSAGDIIDFVINSNTGIKSVGLFIKIRRTS